MTLRLLVVDDHPVVRMGLVAMLSEHADFEVVGEAADGAEAVAARGPAHPDVVLMDLRMPVMDGPEATAKMLASPPAPAVLVLTTYDTDADIVRAVEAGANGYLLKDAPRETLADAIRRAARGETVLAPPVVARLASRLRAPTAPTLTDREAQVLQCVAKGMSNAAGRARAAHRRGDREDPPAPSLREARGDRPHGGRHGGIQERPDRALTRVAGGVTAGLRRFAPLRPTHLR